MCRALEKMQIFLQMCGGRLEQTTVQDVKWAYGVLQTNAIGLPFGRALYPIVSIMNHSCAPNLTALVNPGEAIAFKANRNLKDNDELNIRYSKNCYIQMGTNSAGRGCVIQIRK